MVIGKQELTRALNAPDEEMRLQALHQLVDAEPQLIAELCFKAFGDESWRVRKEAIALFLRQPASRDKAGEVAGLLYAEENAGLRNAAVEILTRLGRVALPVLFEQAASPDHDVRKFVVDILGDIGDENAVPALITALGDEDSNVRAAAAENIGKLKAAAGVPALLDAMQHPDLLLQFTILDALSRIGAPVDAARLICFRQEKLLRKALVDCLGAVGDASAAGELVECLNDSMRNVREAATLALGRFAERFPQATRDALRSVDPGPLASSLSAYLADGGSPQLKQAAIRILGWLAVADVALPLLDLLDDEFLQRDCLQALGEIARVQPAALLQIWDEVDNRHRASLAYVFAEADCQAALPQLKAALTSEHPQLQRMAAYTLGKLGRPEVLPELAAALLQGAADVQESAAQALIDLGALFPRQTLAEVAPILQSDDTLQRRLAVTVLGRLTDASISEQLCLALKDPDAEVRRAAVRAFESRDAGDFLGSILLALTDEDAEVRCTAAEILGRQHGDDVLAGLELALRDEDLWVRCAALRSLGRQGGERARRLVESACVDTLGMVSITALETLVDMIGSQACEQLVAALDHPDQEVVTAVLNLLSSCEDDQWLAGRIDTLINHPYWAVRSHFARLAVQLLGEQAAGILRQRLQTETEDLVRQQLEDLLGGLEG
ncbi:MAG: HEAT repeat domain-containing protein [Desulfuromonadales bacterium]|nr:HEAT repeat domain-containing protein [Desulfuromonadales bacterium]